MSAFYGLCYPDRVELLTDAAFYTADGTLTDIREKVWRSPYVPMAITGRGSGGVTAGFGMAIVALSGVGSFDRTIELTADLIERSKTIAVPDHAEIVITGISETSGPRIFFFATSDAYGMPGFEPWTLYDVGTEWGGGTMPHAEELAGLDASTGLASCGADLFEAMRRIKGPNPARPDLPELYGIGGHVDLTVVTAAGVTTSRLRTWPDVVGQKIEPLAMAA